MYTITRTTRLTKNVKKVGRHNNAIDIQHNIISCIVLRLLKLEEMIKEDGNNSQTQRGGFLELYRKDMAYAELRL